MTLPWITVAVCTWNRATLLGAALERLVITRAPAGLPWEVVVVDNGSTDRTPAVIQAFGARLPLRSVREPRPGVSHARNAAVAAAAGTYVLWLDDDELVSPGWLTDYGAAARAYPTVEAFGGPIVPWYDSWGTTPPPWLAKAMLAAPGLAGSYGALDLGPTPRLLTPTEYLWNGNLMVRTAAHRQVPYDGAFGRRPGSRRGGGSRVPQPAPRDRTRALSRRALAPAETAPPPRGGLSHPSTDLGSGALDPVPDAQCLRPRPSQTGSDAAWARRRG
jgi:glycosyltransferase involved in cell wall biosynthesis